MDAQQQKKKQIICGVIIVAIVLLVWLIYWNTNKDSNRDQNSTEHYNVGTNYVGSGYWKSSMPYYGASHSLAKLGSEFSMTSQGNNEMIGRYYK